MTFDRLLISAALAMALFGVLNTLDQRLDPPVDEPAASALAE